MTVTITEPIVFRLPRFKVGSPVWLLRGMWASLRIVFSLPRDAIAALGMTILALLMAVHVVAEYLADPRTLGQVLGPPAVIIVVVGVSAVLSRMVNLSRPVPHGKLCAHCIRGEGANATKEDVIRHELGHVKLLRHYGVGTGFFPYSVWKDGKTYAGATTVGSWSKFDKLPLHQKIAIYAAGGIAMGTWSHSNSDMATIQWMMNHSPADERVGAKARGIAEARRVLG